MRLFFKKPKVGDKVYELTLLRTGCVRRREYLVVCRGRGRAKLEQPFKEEREVFPLNKFVWNKHHKKWYLRRFR